MNMGRSRRLGKHHKGLKTEQLKGILVEHTGVSKGLMESVRDIGNREGQLKI